MSPRLNEFVTLLPQTDQEIVIQAHGAGSGMAEQKRTVTLPVSGGRPRGPRPNTLVATRAARRS